MPAYQRHGRPWGWYETVLDEGTYLIKRLWIEPGQRLSLQRHRHRQEHWVVVAGGGELHLDGREASVQMGQSVHIPMGAVHRATAGGAGLLIVEVQRGEHLSEDDIERLSDDYGRADPA
ncbi:MAG: phosphomannose isomerase type II C-terminal cupin domain [Cyanobacteriota bacterium]